MSCKHTACTNESAFLVTCPHLISGDMDKLGYLLMAVVERSKLSRVTEVQLTHSIKLFTDVSKS